MLSRWSLIAALTVIITLQTLLHFVWGQQKDQPQPAKPARDVITETERPQQAADRSRPEQQLD